MNVFIDVKPNKTNDALTDYLLYAEIGNSDSEYGMIGHASIMSVGKFKFLCNVEMDTDYRGCGYGKQFIQDLVDTYGANCLTVNTDNNVAIHIYTSLGFFGDDIVHEKKKINGIYEEEESYIMSTIPMDELDKIELFESIMNICETVYGYVYSNEYNNDIANVHRCHEIEKEPY